MTDEKIDIDVIMDRLEKIIESIAPEERANLIRRFSDTFGNASEDALLWMHVDDICCDGNCATCSPEEKQECLTEMREVILYLIGEVKYNANRITKNAERLKFLSRRVLGIDDEDAKKLMGLIDDENDENETENDTLYS